MYLKVRDRNVQSWLLKQFYHVLIQSSIPIINGDHKASYHHLSSAWLVARDLVNTLPEFLVFSIERGVMTLGLQLEDVAVYTGSKGGLVQVILASHWSSLSILMYHWPTIFQGQYSQYSLLICQMWVVL